MQIMWGQSDPFLVFLVRVTAAWDRLIPNKRRHLPRRISLYLGTYLHRYA